MFKNTPEDRQLSRGSEEKITMGSGSSFNDPLLVIDDEEESA